MTACFLINRMSSLVPHDQVLHSILLPNQSLFNLPLQVFTCPCVAHILSPYQDKLLAKATECSSLDICIFNVDIVAIPLTHIDTSSFWHVLL